MRGIQGTAGEVGEITVLKSKPKSADALALLKKIHHLTKPIMKKHGWYLPTLSEFFPTNPNLLGININGGHKICIRLRPQHAPDSFLDLDQLIGTMLHELTHNVRGPHDQIFYKQLDELQDEFDKLGQTGYLAWTGDGRRVGAGVGHNVGMEQARKLALEKLEQREKMARLLGKGGKLGGIAVDTKGKRRSDIIADATERRLRDQKACGGDESHEHASGSAQKDLPPAVQADIERAMQDSEVHTIDLTSSSDEESDGVGDGIASSTSEHKATSTSSSRARPPPIKESLSDSDSDIEIVAGPPKRHRPFALPSTSSNSTPKPPTPSTSNSTFRPPHKPSSATTTTKSEWSCPACTFSNPFSFLSCEICATERPTSLTRNLGQATKAGSGSTTASAYGTIEGWACIACGTVTSHDFWTCMTCGRVKESSARPA